ncbi:hypothetical protein H8356DRAFT_1624882 [Neocallimastix lanati (nom. inval.)]|jgi:hypothetical protein|uniref:Mid2 domain-containing protein n=1 Tax=Neocallimastix californiae TaxID=1754190 RepID=A0A1Y2EZY8_9FUNG|nr:hypothetical protein H8356DRAFT_1624882 [Neocallimastix sp. JGI-2020a]ORY76824.1 hypothetical protein LY90DRAFT_698746 [Neocallimastix californiae]|eukprot:ORY76824.1 hypothetical protein LY90DRAFT_698746 [Neocallimastix californiae]
MSLISQLIVLLLILFIEIPPTKGEVNGPCKNSNGICISTQSCTIAGGTFQNGLCPNDPDNIRCCNKSCTYKGYSGLCSFKSECAGTYYTGLCPGNANFVCCINNPYTSNEKTSAGNDSNDSSSDKIKEEGYDGSTDGSINSSVDKIEEGYNGSTGDSIDSSSSSSSNTSGSSNTRDSGNNGDTDDCIDCGGPKPKKSKLIYIIAPIGSLLVLGSVFLFILNRRNKHNKGVKKNSTFEFGNDPKNNTTDNIYKHNNDSDKDSDIVVYKRQYVKSNLEDNTEIDLSKTIDITQRSIPNSPIEKNFNFNPNNVIVNSKIQNIDNNGNSDNNSDNNISNNNWNNDSILPSSKFHSELSNTDLNNKLNPDFPINTNGFDNHDISDIHYNDQNTVLDKTNINLNTNIMEHTESILPSYSQINPSGNNFTF